MNTVTLDSIKTLLRPHTHEVVSIYFSLRNNSSPLAVRENQSRFKNLIRKATELLKNMKSDRVTRYGDELEVVLADQNTWTQGASGLGVFVSDDGLQVYKLPVECEEHVSVGDAFDMLPILAVANFNQSYYLLALAIHEPRLFKGDMYGVKAVEIDFPSSPEEALNIDEMYSNSNTIRNGAGGSSAGAHGQGDSREAGNEERLKYFRIIDDLIFLRDAVDTSLPVLLAGMSSELAEYRNISRLKLLESHIDGNHTRSTTNELHEIAWPCADTELNSKKVDNALIRYDELYGAKKATHDLDEIKEAAADGRIDTLLLGLWSDSEDDDQGPIDAAVDGKRLISYPGEEQTAINKLANLVLNQGGSVMGVDAEDLPEPSSAAALLRY